MIPVWARPRAIQRINAQFLQALMWIFTSHPDSSYPFFVGSACTLDMASGHTCKELPQSIFCRENMYTRFRKQTKVPHLLGQIVHSCCMPVPCLPLENIYWIYCPQTGRPPNVPGWSCKLSLWTSKSASFQNFSTELFKTPFKMQRPAPKFLQSYICVYQ